MANASSGRNGPHDVGGVLPIDNGGHPVETVAVDHSSIAKLADWEVRVDALMQVLSRKGLINVHQLRRGIESLDGRSYASFSYFAKWATSVTIALLEGGTIRQAEFDAQYGPPEQASSEQLFQKGDHVRVRGEDFATRWRKPHLRTPGYIFNAHGVIERYCGLYGNPETLAFPFGQTTADKEAIKAPLYRVRFQQMDLWEHYSGSEKDTIEVEIYQQWLIPEIHPQPPAAKRARVEKDPEHEHDASQHHHDHEHDHVHEEREQVEQTALVREGEPDPGERVARALITTLVDKGVVSHAEIRQAIEMRESLGQEMRGFDFVVKAWQDAEFKQRLLLDGNAAAKEMNIDMEAHLVVVENTDSLRNVVVCTLCSCYPTQLLGRPPAWYKSRSYRARMPVEPRKVLLEFGSPVPETCEVRVHDSSADCRYMVLPQRPDGTEGCKDEELRKLVSRDMLVGVTATKD